jgi:hypothetical protein
LPRKVLSNESIDGGRNSALVLRHAKELRESVQRVRDLEQQADVERYRNAVARILDEMLYEILNPLFAEHPGLKPPKML